MIKQINRQIEYRTGYKNVLNRPYCGQTSVFPDEIAECGFITLYPDGIIVVGKEYAWDGPSGPTFDTPTFMRGSLHHDAMYQLMREGVLPISYREQVDLDLKHVCLQDGMSRLRAWYVYRAVRKFGEKSATKAGGKTIVVAP